MQQAPRRTTIRPARAADMPSIEAILCAAFPTNLESRLVSLLTRHRKSVISLLASLDEEPVGHVLFSPAKTRGFLATCEGLGLGPLAVLPQHQRKGIGANLVRAGIDECRRLNVPWVVVLGEPAYYGRFGFEPARRYDVSGEFGGGDAFQIMVFDEGRKPAQGSQVEYAEEFGEVFRAGG